MPSITNLLSYALIVTGLIFWFWGTSNLLKKRSVLFKLHSLSVADTLGSILIVTGLIFLYPSGWPLLLLAIIALTLWNTMLGYVLAHCSSNTAAKNIRGI
ncbi:MAG: monovalent cation/H(+) antiporter subunit G [Pseudanabaenaceae cyanobacterium bins.39]|nr:monovalent cation/H(+) antiporter subunit G [Pseudanabaenaceae cyanobacterium bins.39]